MQGIAISRFGPGSLNFGGPNSLALGILRGRMR
jgi:hypothetical protein